MLARADAVIDYGFLSWLVEKKEEEQSTTIRKRKMFGLGSTNEDRSIYNDSHHIEASKILCKLLK